MSSTEDPRILTRTQFCFEMRDLVDTLRLADQDSIRHRIDQSDRAQRERIATLEADNRRLWELCADAKRLFLDELQLNPANPKDMELLGNGTRDCVREIDRALSALQPAAPPTCKDSLQVQPPARHGKDGNGDQLRDTTKVIQPSATQPSGNTGEFKCARCGVVLCSEPGSDTGFRCDECGWADAFSAEPDCSAAQPATESEVEELKPENGKRPGGDGAVLGSSPSGHLKDGSATAATDADETLIQNTRGVESRSPEAISPTGKALASTPNDSATSEIAQPATEQPRIWRVAFRDKKGRQYSEFQRTEELADLHVEWHRTQTVLGPTFDVRKQYSTDNGETWVDEPTTEKQG